jgi:hypothetical protein
MTTRRSLFSIIAGAVASLAPVSSERELRLRSEYGTQKWQAAGPYHRFDPISRETRLYSYDEIQPSGILGA